MDIQLRREVLREYIARRNISQNSFAIKANVSSGYMAQLLIGKRKPSGPVRAKLMKASGMKFDQLFLIVHREDNHAEAA